MREQYQTKEFTYMADMTSAAEAVASGPLSESYIWLFGSLAYSFDDASFKDLCSKIHENESNSWLLECISNLPKLYEQANSEMGLHDATADAGTVLSTLVDVVNCFDTGQGVVELNFPLQNTVLIPLAIVSQLADFSMLFTQRRDCPHSQTTEWHRETNGKEVMGLCTGILAALAVASSQSFDEFKQHAMAAVHIGMLAGMAVDHQENVLGKRARSLSVSWEKDRSCESMLAELELLSSSYISVYYDYNRVTMVASVSDQLPLIERLRNIGCSVSEIDLYGAFHASGNTDLVNRLIAFCALHGDFQLPDASKLNIQIRSGVSSGKEGGIVTVEDGPLHAYALKCILQDRCHWFDAFSAALQEHESKVDNTAAQNIKLLIFGPNLSVPLSLLPKVALLRAGARTKNVGGKGMPPTGVEKRPWAVTDIAVVGMACKVAGADDIGEFWDLLVEGKSQHQDLAETSRIPFQNARSRAKGNAGLEQRKWFANLIRGHDEFDHRFFKKTARESAAMDPQQRQLLQIAYQAVQQSGYFSTPTAERENHVGCFVGVCQTDYENNIACHPPGAFTATGNLRGFLAGKVSHYFGWTGPGLAIDTACSSSLVAVHQACNSILSGECSMALACGSHVITCPDMFQNLAAAQFLSPTGQCKPFDTKADGYCRGEGVGAVFLKRLDTALVDKDQILGVIAGTAVQQNQNCTPLFVPNGPSLSSLFERVLKKADTRPEHVSVVEAHGTGTAVGDPAEYASIRQVLGGERRAGDRSNLLVTSVKGLVGHLECTSGIVSLIKVLLMMRNNAVPPQASFTEASPALLAKSTDYMQVPTSLNPWDSDFKIALVNNYGASGSNAAAVVMQPPKLVALHPHTRLPGGDNTPHDGIMYPFWISAHDEDSIRRYAGALKKLVVDSSAARQPPTVATISFSLEHQSNRDLQHGLLFKASSAKELEMRLTDVENYTSEAIASALTSVRPPTTERPRVVLCFGGQVATFIGIDRSVYETVAIFRKHLHDVDEAIQAHGAASIFPSLFQRTPIADTVVLQTALFATQYACAKSWIDCGVQPVSIVGHSFGELTALCVSGVLSLEDAVKMIVRRATAVRDHWGLDPGSMVAVDGEPGDVTALLAQVNRNSSELSGTPASIACYNGPRSFTLAGPARAMEQVVTGSRHAAEEGSAIKSKRLNVTNSFHCALVDPLLDHLHEVGRDLTFHRPSIHVERATESAAPLQFKASFVADHMRKPVYFDHAVRRINEQFSSSSSPLVFLEAGTNSGITSLAARVLRGSAADRSYGFHGLDLCKDGAGWNNLVKTTQALWESGIACKFWAHHKFQRENHDDPGYLLLPPYQFNAHSHWLDLKQREELDSGRKSTQRQDDSLIQIVSQNFAAGTMEAQFHVNTQHTTYLEMLSGHNTIQTAPICPAAVQIGLVSQAFSILHPDYHTTETVPLAKSTEYHSPICPNSNTQLWIHVSGRSNEPEDEWDFAIFSAIGADGDRSVHTTGYLSFVRPSNTILQAELDTFSRLIRHDRVVEMLQSTLANDVLGSRAIYKLFAEVVDYSMKYQGMERLACFERESAARITRKELTSTTFISSLRDAYLSDAFFQPGGFCINCLADGTTDSVYLAHKIQQWIQKPMRASSDEFHAFTSHSKISSDQWLTDVFVFDAADGSLVQVILGLSFVKIPRAAMQRALARMSNMPTSVRQAALRKIDTTATSTAPWGERKTPSVPLSATPKEMGNPRTKAPSTSLQSTSPDLSAVFAQLRTIVSELMGAPADRIRDNDSLLNLGVDSLTGMELINEIESSFHIRLPTTTVLSISDFASLAQSVADTISQQQPAQSRNSTHEHDASPSHTEDEASDGTGNDCPTSEPNTPRTSETSWSTNDKEEPEMNSTVADGLTETAAREAVVAEFVNKLTAGFSEPLRRQANPAVEQIKRSSSQPTCVLITGATGGLGSHIVAEMALQDGVNRVICLNRRNRHGQDPWERQQQAIRKQDLELPGEALRKLTVLETDLSKGETLGLPEETYASLVGDVTHIVHNAWLMHFKWPLKQFEPQLRIMANLLSFARDISLLDRGHRPVTFLFNSSIAAVACHPLWTGQPDVAEVHVPIESAFSNGYAEAKHACERMLATTLGGHAARFRAATVRIGQIAGNSTSGRWNSTEHIPLLVKSSQTIGALPDLPGTMAWVPADDVAGVIAEILLQPDDVRLRAVYHVENPSRQPWGRTVALLAAAIEVPVVPLREWLRRVRRWPREEDNVPSGANPAHVLADFFEHHFVRTSCGGLLMASANTVQHSPRMANLGPVSDGLILKYMNRWVDDGFLERK